MTAVDTGHILHSSFLKVPLVPVFSEQMLQPASFLSQYLPSELDPYIPAAYARQVVQHSCTVALQMLSKNSL